MKVNILTITSEEQIHIRKEIESPQEADKLIKEYRNQSLNILKAVKNTYKWTDLEEIDSFLRVLRIFGDKKNEKATAVDIEISDVRAMIQILKALPAKSDGIHPDLLEKYFQLLKTFEVALTESK